MLDTRGGAVVRYDASEPFAELPVIWIPSRTAVAIASPIAVPPKPRNSPAASTASPTSSWSRVGGVATCASPANSTRPTRTRDGTLSRNVWIALWAAANLVGLTSTACIDPETSSTRITVALSLVTSDVTCGRDTAMQSAAIAARKRLVARYRRHGLPDAATSARRSTFVYRTA